MSLVSQLMSGVTESSVDLSEYDFTESASMESWYLDAACEALVSDIFNIDKAYHVADVVGEVKVLTEGADPEVLLEGMVGDAIAKIKEAFKKFLAKIKAWAAQVKKVFQVLFMKGKDLAKKYGNEIRTKSVTGFKYKGYKYTIAKGDTIVDTVSSGVKAEIDTLCGGMDALKDMDEDARQAELKKISGAARDNGTVVFQKSIKSKYVNDIKSDMSTSDYQDKLISKLVSGASDISEMTQNISEAYRDGDTDKRSIEDFEANSPDDMVEFLSKFDKAVKDIDKEEKAFEKDVNMIIKSLDKISGQTTKRDGSKKSITYTLASKISGFMSTALAVRKSAVDKKVAIYKEINGSWTSVLKSFVLKKEVKESAFFEDFDSMIALTEAADVEPETPDPEEDMAGEGCGAKSAKEGCGGKKTCESLLEAAYNYL